MKDRVFIDTNILIYANTDLDSNKQNISRTIIESTECVISTQVIQEFSNIFLKKIKLENQEILKLLKDIIDFVEVYTNQYYTIIKAIEISEKHNYSFYDCTIIAYAIESGCSIIYSEDMQHGYKVNPKLQILNPFL